MFDRIGIVGCGLIGGSFALAVHRHYPNIDIHGVNRRLDAITADPRSACFSGLYSAIQDLPPDLDLVVVCTPISSVASIINDLSAHMNASCILSDMASVKQPIIDALGPPASSHLYIPGHPMAGTEKTGFANANATLYQESPYFLVPQADPRYATLKDFIQPLVGSVIEIDAATHDSTVALMSHLPYFVACSLVNLASNSGHWDAIQQSFGPGFKDTTRVAGSDPSWGIDVATHNKQALLESLSGLIKHLQNLETAIENDSINRLKESLLAAQTARKQLSH